MLLFVFLDSFYSPCVFFAREHTKVFDGFLASISQISRKNSDVFQILAEPESA